MPLDWGLKPPIATLPQISQERAMVRKNLVGGEADLWGMCRLRTIAAGSRATGIAEEFRISHSRQGAPPQ